MPLQATSGAASYDAFGGGVAAVPNYIEDVFSTYLYTGTGASQTITTGIDVSTKGGIVWTKARATNSASSDHVIHQTNGNSLVINGTGAEYADGDFGSITTTGFTLPSYPAYNASGKPFASWTFRKQPKFFDVVYFQGDGTSSRNIPHELESKPHCIILKNTSSDQDWFVSHIGVNSGLARVGKLNTTAAFATSSEVQVFYSNDSTFRVGDAGNNSGENYVAYLFAHNAGGFGLTGTDNVISCGSYTSNSGGAINVELGFEPQWILLKNTAGRSAGWVVLDTMRGFSNDALNNLQLLANASYAELDVDEPGAPRPTATGFSLAAGNNYAEYNYNTDTIIYIAIRRGPMKVPTSGTSVFVPAVQGRTPTNPTWVSGFAADWVFTRQLGISDTRAMSRLQGFNYMETNSTGSEGSDTNGRWDFMNGFGIEDNQTDKYAWMFRRASSFFDVVCYTGTGSAQNITHNLGVAPAIVIVKSRSLSASDWRVNLYNVLGSNQGAILNSTGAAFTDTTAWNSTAPTSTTFRVGTPNDVNASGYTYVAYLFATCAGVSKVGSYTGSDSDLNIDCGFTSGARFVMIKRTDASSDWYVWDSARGIVSGNDPRLSLNTTAAEVTDMNMINPYSAGFSIPAGGPNTGAGATFIYLAIA